MLDVSAVEVVDGLIILLGQLQEENKATANKMVEQVQQVTTKTQRKSNRVRDWLSIIVGREKS